VLETGIKCSESSGGAFMLIQQTLQKIERGLLS
jgi:hypothetical protein